jgi:hypothetical protein
MKVKKKKAKTSVIPAGQTGVALPKEWEDQLAKEAQDAAAIERPETAAFSLRGGILAFGGQAIKDNKMNTIVLATAHERAYFDTDWDPKNIRSPVCFALSTDGSDLAPHANSLSKQADACEGCPMNEWGSDPKGGRGKACKEVRRLACMSDTALDDLDAMLDAQVANLRVPVTSVRNWGGYVHKLASGNRPPWSVITEVHVVADAKSQFQVNFDLVEAITDGEELKEVAAQRKRATALVMVPYQMATELKDEDEEERPKVKKKRKF